MSDLEINLLDAPAWQKTILHAMARYGMYVGDTGGPGWEIKLWSALSYRRAGRGDPWSALGQRLGVPGSRRYVFDLPETVDWASRLRVARPCVSRRSC